MLTGSSGEDKSNTRASREQSRGDESEGQDVTG